MRLLERLWRKETLPLAPQIIYLDSAHEVGETVIHRSPAGVDDLLLARRGYLRRRLVLARRVALVWHDIGWFASCMLPTKPRRGRTDLGELEGELVSRLGIDARCEIVTNTSQLRKNNRGGVRICLERSGETAFLYNLQWVLVRERGMQVRVSADPQCTVLRELAEFREVRRAKEQATRKRGWA